MSESCAKVIRIITLPQVLVFFLILLLGDQIPPWHHEMAIVLLCVVPLISYLYWRISPELREQGRKSQRKLAIIFSVTGYILGTIYCIAFGGSKTELFMYLCYVICGVLIALSSYGFHIKSSGHAAGVVGPVMILSLRVSPWYLFGLLLMIPVGISSVRLGRHTPKELLLGSCYPVIATLILQLFLRG